MHVGLPNYIRTTVDAYAKTEGRPKLVKLSSTQSIRSKTATTVPQKKHQEWIGRLLWIMRVGRPDIAQAVSQLGSRVACWNHECDAQMKQLMGYLAATADYRLEFSWPVEAQGKFDSFEAEIHSDADWRGSEKSQSSFFAWVRPKGYSTGGCPIHWQSKKQSVTSDSVSSAEIVAAHLAFKEGSWPMMAILTAMGRNEHDFTLRVDNNTCLKHIVNSPTDTVAHQLKAIDTRLGYLHDLHENQLFKCNHVESAYNRSDLGTKCPRTVEEQDWWRSSVNLQLPLNYSDAETRKKCWLATHGTAPDPKVLKGNPADDQDSSAFFSLLMNRTEAPFLSGDQRRVINSVNLSYYAELMEFNSYSRAE